MVEDDLVIKNICALLIGAAGTGSVPAYAVDAPAVGLLAQLTVVDKGLKPAARPNYIFTSKKLKVATVFTGFEAQSPKLTVVCCYQVVDLNPLSLDNEIKKYSYDTDFVERMRSVRGYKYIYSAQNAPKDMWSKFMKTINSVPREVVDSAEFSTPVVEGVVKADSVKSPFELNGEKISVSTKYGRDSDKVIYSFNIDGNASILSENIPSVE